LKPLRCHAVNVARLTLPALKAERASLAAQSRRIEAEAAPIRYVAELIGTDTDSQRAIRVADRAHGPHLRSAGDRAHGRGFRNETRHRMSKPRSYIRPDDGAMMLEVEPNTQLAAVS
jgi:hypothetical protein